MELKGFFEAKTIAVVGVSSSPEKVGHVIFKNLLDSGYNGKIFPVNPKYKTVINRTCYESVLAIDDKVDLAVIAVPASNILGVVEECGKKKIRSIVVVTSGFSEVGNVKLEQDLLKLIKKYKIRLIGPNVLGIYDSYTGLDTLFLPRLRLTRPGKGGISFVCQSGAVGSAVLDLVASQGYGFAKFISYGNNLDVDETEILEFLGRDKDSRVICMYIEGLKDGKRFIDVAKKIKKPVIVVKGGVTREGSEAVISHTGSLAGDSEVYKGAFKQAGVIQADNLEELFDYAKILDKCIKARGDRVQVITNGGGYGILCADSLSENNLKLAKFSKVTERKLKKLFKDIVILKNPVDLLGDASTGDYKNVIEFCLDDDKIDVLLVVVLFQTPLIGSDVVDILIEFNDIKKKPIIVVSTGGEFTQLHKRKLEERGIPCYSYPHQAASAIRKLVDFSL